jgi:hypothetical protein
MAPAVGPRPASAGVEDVWLRLASAGDGPRDVDVWASAFRWRGGLRPESVLELQPGAARRHVARTPEAKMARPGFARMDPLQPIPGIDSDGRVRRLAEFAVEPQPICCERGCRKRGDAGTGRRGEEGKRRRGDIPVSSSLLFSTSPLLFSSSPLLFLGARVFLPRPGTAALPCPNYGCIIGSQGLGTLTVRQPWESDSTAPMGIS